MRPKTNSSTACEGGCAVAWPAKSWTDSALAWMRAIVHCVAARRTKTREVTLAFDPEYRVVERLADEATMTSVSDRQGVAPRQSTTRARDQGVGQVPTVRAVPGSRLGAATTLPRHAWGKFLGRHRRPTSRHPKKTSSADAEPQHTSASRPVVYLSGRTSRSRAGDVLELLLV